MTNDQIIRTAGCYHARRVLAEAVGNVAEATVMRLAHQMMYAAWSGKFTGDAIESDGDAKP